VGVSALFAGVGLASILTSTREELLPTMTSSSIVPPTCLTLLVFATFSEATVTDDLKTISNYVASATCTSSTSAHFLTSVKF
jgi:hypothetical protein